MPRIHAPLIPLLLLLVSATSTSLSQTPTADTAPASQPATAADTQPTTQPESDENLPPGMTREARTARLLNHLQEEYERILKSKDWMNRSLALICLARVPGEKPADRLLIVLKSDPHPTVKLTAWHCLASRAPALTPAQHTAFLDHTLALAKLDTFKGESRASILELLALHPPDARSKQVFKDYFANTNLLAQGGGGGGGGDGDDRVVILALASTLRSWKSPDLVEFLISRLTVLKDAYRAERILRLANKFDDPNIAARPGESPASDKPAPPPLALKHSPLGSENAWRTTQKEYKDWWAREKPHWKELATSRAAELSSPFIPTPELDPKNVNPKDPAWRKDLELSAPEIRALTVSYVIDATGSMQLGIDWVKSELTRTMAALSLISKEPKLGITFYRDNNDEFIAATSPMLGTDKINTLIDWVAKMKATGGGDQPEAVREGLLDSLKKNTWPNGERAKKIIILVGDAPPHEASMPDIEKMTKLAAEKGFRFYAVSLSPACYKEFSAITTAGNGENFPIALDYSARFAGVFGAGYATGGANAEGIPFEIANEWRWQLKTSRAAPAAAPRAGRVPGAPAEEAIPFLDSAEGCQKLMTRILLDAINPQYKDRVSPAIAILLNSLSPNAAPETRRAFESFTPKPRRTTAPLP